jgi:hypothetical protein
LTRKRHEDRKGKPVERRGRKATGLNPEQSGQDSRAAEVILNDAFGLYSKGIFFPKHYLSEEGSEPFEWRTAVKSGSESDKKETFRKIRNQKL